MTPLERRILTMESQWWLFEGAKAERIVADLEITPTRYAQILNRLLDDPEALAVAPMTVNRLRRVRDAKLGARSLRLVD